MTDKDAPCSECGGEGLVPTPRTWGAISTSLTEGYDICPTCKGSGKSPAGEKGKEK